LIDGEKYFDRDQNISERPNKQLEKQKLVDKEKADQPQRGGQGARRPQ